MPPQIKVKWKVKNHVRTIEKHINSVLEARLDAVSQQMNGELRQALSRPGPSTPGNPPGLTQHTHKQRLPGKLMKSIGWYRDKKLRRRIGTPVPYGYWLEMGVRGGKVIRPVKAKALLVPITKMMALSIKASRHRKGSGRGGFLGLVEDPSGQWFMLRSFVIQGPIAPRPWLKPTFLKNLRKIGLTLSQKIY